MSASLEFDLRHRVTAIFESVHRSLGGLVALGFADANGLPVAFFGPTMEKEAATAMASLLMSAARRAAQILTLPEPRDVVIDAGDSVMIVRPIGERFTLVAILRDDANVGHAKLLLQGCSDDLLLALEVA